MRADTATRTLVVSSLVLVMLSAPAAAQMEAAPPPAPICAASAAATGAYAPWNRPSPLTAGREAAAPAMLTLGTAAQVNLSPTPDVHYAQRPEKPGGSVSYGGLLGFDVVKAGTYRIALGSAAWLDVIGRQGPMRSVAHGHGPDCTGIRKMVDFTLESGHYLVQISANGGPVVTVLALTAPDVPVP
ncbi:MULTISPECIES: hypothetical protein [unclassified Novosphingobium]|uniref:hypothetical protein n=1 Tax=unclassified Novosphingobium TaxID=2644732 RepID=UPI000D2F7D1D|nr:MULTISPECIES: hypothetical protein [unclassified Novosphingobium]PTR07304.1 hypothetical protein C8K11_116100 [Novosphingobium sp. GV055]PUB00117.1 hypothetical protein C8K12_116100 [Novosphingobium sp. GV061]PUB15087.1 hypothetical protein C8K14_116100 [Novosphingobium sp. GV079]PUB39146.1 hypothetical protein C8K10_116100 [Novosphingobium sp. GV027]